LLLEVLRPLLLALGPVLLPAREEAVAGLPEAQPDGLRLRARHGADRLPLLLEPLELVRGLEPIGGLREGLRLLAQLLLPAEVLGELLGLLREVGVDLRLDRVARALEARPEGLALLLRRFLRLPPPCVQVLELPGRGFHVLGEKELLGLRAQLFLHR